MILSRCVDIKFVKNGNCYKVLAKPLPIKVKKEIQKQLKNGNPVLKITDKNKDNTLLKFIRKKFVKNERINKLFELYKNKSVMELKNIRHQIIHRRPISFNLSIDNVDALFNVQGISFNPNGWIDFNTLEKNVQENIKIIKDALIILNQIIWFDDFPNTKDNQDEIFFAKNIECSNCQSKDKLIAVANYAI